MIERIKLDENLANKAREELKELVYLQDGENKFTLNLEEPVRFVPTKFVDKVVYTLKDETCLLVTLRLHKVIMSFFSNNEPIENIKIIRTGNMKDTRYEVSKL